MRAETSHGGDVLSVLLVSISAVVYGLVTVPFYAYGVPPEVAGSSQTYDVKNFWPFGYDGPGALVHVVAMMLSVVSPLIFGIGVVATGVLLAEKAGNRKLRAALMGMHALFLVTTLVHWSAITAWHFD